MNDTTERSLIELAREKIERARCKMASNNLSYAAGVVAGYEAGVASVHHDGVRDYSGALKVANKRIVELEAQLAAAKDIDPYNPLELVADFQDARNRIKELKAQLAASENFSTSRTCVAVGVVVDEEMVVAMRNEWYKPMSDGENVWRRVLTAALTSATTVPLASAEPVRWLDDKLKSSHATREIAAIENDTTVSPLYRGVSEPAQRRHG